MTCYVIIRQTLQWEHARYENLITPFIQQVARLWDSTFQVTYVDCRARLKKLTYSCLNTLTTVNICKPSDIDIGSLYPEDILLICDDDDWYHPCVVEHLQEHIRERKLAVDSIVVWPDGVYGCTKIRQLPGQVRERNLEDGVSIVKTNNYAITGSVIRETPELLTTMRHHGGAIRYMASTSLNVLKLRTPLSLVNRHPCSQSVLKGNLETSDLGENGGILKSLVKHYVYDDHTKIQTAFKWASHYISQSKAIFREVLGSC